ncbi:MAG TPA: protein kinase [Nocardioides sp.]|nr:protein kinase [Nocardioides sp.]
MSTRTEPRYRLEHRIATGGMGEVWRATDTVLDRQVAVKVLKPEYADDPTFRSRFQAEARHAAALHHHNVASVFDFGELEPDDGSGSPRPYLVMELVPGEPLSALLRADEPMDPARAAELAAQAAEGIAAAHALGIVHRDVKPANLLVTPRGQVKITDFGIARAADGATLTQTGQVIGTPAYISPEQAEGRSATTASDVYSLGVVLYECLAGRRPFQQDTPVATAIAHLRDEPPPLPDTVPESLRAIVATALAKDPAHRFPTMAALAEALRGGPLAVPGAAAATAVPEQAPVAEPIPIDADAPGGTRVLTGVVPGAGPSRPGGPGRPAWLPWAVAALAVLLVVVLVSVAVGGEEPVDPAAEETAASTPTEEPATRDEPQTFRLDPQDYVGMPKDEARSELEALGLDVKDEQVENTGDRPEGTVADVDPTRRLEQGDQVTLAVWGPAPEDDGGDDDGGDGGTSGGPGKGKAKGKKKG